MIYDKIDELPESLKKHLPKFVENRLNEAKELQKEFLANNEEAILKWTHKLIGISASYNLYQLEDIAKSIENNIKNNFSCDREIDFANINTYLQQLSNRIAP